jgi:hypothetical protein
MEVTTWYLEPVAGISEQRLHKELAKLREGNNVQWGIAEVIERMYAVRELVMCVDVTARKGRRDVSASEVLGQVTSSHDDRADRREA